MGAIVFWGAVTTMLIGAGVLERRRRRRLHQRARKGTLRPEEAHGGSSQAIDSPQAAEGLFRGGLSGPFPR